MNHPRNPHEPPTPGKPAPPADAAGGAGTFTRPEDLELRPDTQDVATSHDPATGPPAMGGRAWGLGVALVLVLVAIVATTCLGAP